MKILRKSLVTIEIIKLNFEFDCRYTDIWRNKIHEDGLEKSAQQNGNVDTNEAVPIIRSVNLREVRTIQNQLTHRVSSNRMCCVC